VGRTNPDLIRPWRGIALILATFALAFKLMIPAGFMAAPGQAGLPFQVVLCTSQGMVVADASQMGGSQRDPDQPPAQQEKPCMFAGHGAALSPPALLEMASVTFAGYTEIRPEPFASVVPGRGLAAPPPPSRGPPSLTI
jgi:hypothetical protein